MTDKNDNFDFNVLNTLFDMLGMSQEEKKLMLSEIIRTVTEVVYSQADVDEAKVTQLLETKDLNGLNAYLIDQLGGGVAFAQKLKEASESLINALVDDFLKTADEKQAAEFRQYLKEHNLRVKELGL